MPLFSFFPIKQADGFQTRVKSERTSKTDTLQVSTQNSARVQKVSRPT